MKWAVLGLLCLSLVIAGTQAEEAEVVLTVNGEDEFNKAVKDSEFLLAEFYAPWCGHCKSLAPEYEKAAQSLKESGSKIVLAKIDATLDENKVMSTKFGVQGFPTLKIFRNGNLDKPSDYAGPRDAAGIVSYLEKVSGPPSKELKTKEEVAEFKEAHDPAVLGVFSGADAAEFKAFEGAADGLRSDFDFAHTFDASLVDEEAPAVVVVKSYDEPVVVFEGKFGDAEISGFVEAATTPKLVEMDQSPKNKKALSRIFADQAKPKILALDAKNEKKFRDILTHVSSKRADRFNTLWTDPSANPQVAKYFGLEDSELPAIAIHDAQNDGKFFLKNAKPGAVNKWLDDWEAGKIEKFIKSEEAPKDNSGPVKVVTANTFDEIVLGGKDVLIEFYAPWCGHCKSLAPIYEELGTKFADNESVTIAKMDATANDVPSNKFEVKGFPTIAFVAGPTGEITVYEGDRSLPDLSTFVTMKLKDSKAAGEKLTEAGTAGEEVSKDEL
ncbi:protein disulfide isomerase [Coccomyxa subellipsoidea C-169]|uniref:Protein disulfide-isomerase n=1 Tax=Coccomyxa subellipsoidea (strain C-169) TaxID=574566 RepID=I0YWW3_COCSC|nr:protein disulfide isomerase [Coccomyxa subellipsoidea C-169]EIE22882.1 protein disulfide isomerase [Coccomyxa subellipsoidea C-169]|eukprot:XP_005647426.1 protein disulfide isomerase [Coccomyxa subellipsoidea C-169]